VDPLAVAAGFGERIDHVLIDGQPAAHGDFLAG
jgi:hypothetical protein